jgi:heme A synthase
LLGAFAATAGLLWLVKLAWEDESLRKLSTIMLALLGVQILLGVEAWMGWMKRAFVPFADALESPVMHWLRSGHYVLGALIFAATVALALMAHRSLAAAPGEAAV